MDRVMTINEWLDLNGIDRSYKKDMKTTYANVRGDLVAQDAKTARELIERLEKMEPDSLPGYGDRISFAEAEASPIPSLMVFRLEDWQALKKELGIKDGSS